MACKQTGRIRIFFDFAVVYDPNLRAVGQSFASVAFLVWFSILTAINFFRWISLRFYHIHKPALIADIRQFKQVLLTGSLLAGIWVGLGNIWFLDPSQLASILIMSIFTIAVAVGAILSWFFYIPAVTAILIPLVGSLAVLLCLHDDKTSLAIESIFIILVICGFVGSMKLGKMLDHALRLSFENVELRRESEEKSLLLGKALAEAEQANAAKTRFLAAASHDLRQPIHALGLFFAELSDRVYSPDTALVIGQVEDSIAAINSMLNSLLDVSKLDAGIVKPTIEPFALSELFARLQAEFQPIALENHNEFHIRPTLAIVNTDPAMLDRMLRNLIGNALRYTENGHILVTARPRGQYIEIKVLDTGSGIPDDQLDEIFVEFHQLQNPARDRRQGLGLGLAIVKRLAKLLQHEIKVTSQLGRGSCFSITLPIAQQTAHGAFESLRDKTSLLNDSLAGCQVLVLDDDIAVLEGMRGLLTRWGCHVITVGSPAEAEDRLTGVTQKLDLLIVDYRLSDHVSGIEVAKKLQDRWGYRFAVLVITGDTEPERLQEADASGYPLLHKPVQPAKLRSTIQYLLGKLNENKL